MNLEIPLLGSLRELIGRGIFRADRGQFFYTIDISEWAIQDSCKYFKLNLWILGIALKVRQFSFLMPCKL